jgi:DNA-binding winged helix-turn-helix (wHTH) protein
LLPSAGRPVLTAATASHPAPRVFQAGPVRFDEARGELHVLGQRRPIEHKPRALLHALLTHGAETASKRALIAAVWGNADHMSETSLTTAMSKLRDALGEDGRTIIKAVHGVGYRIAVPIEVLVAGPPSRLALGFKPLEMVPGRPSWRLECRLGTDETCNTWRARHEHTQATLVIKFTDSTDGLRSLKKQMELSRLLRRALGERDDMLGFTGSNFAARPYFIERPDGGANLQSWAAQQGGLTAINLDQRIDIVARIARIIASAHGAGVMHGHIAPCNILVGLGSDGQSAVRIVDFGAAAHHPSGASTSPTREDGPASAMTDVFALGTLLYQMAAGDFDKALGAGWEADVADPLLRGDIEAAAASDPARRLVSAANLAERLASLPDRRVEQLQAARDAARSAELGRRIERSRLLGPWIAAACVSLALGTILALVFGLQSRNDRDLAQRRMAMAEAVNAFLTEDLLGRGDPARSGKPDETLMHAAAATEGTIDHRLAAEPMEGGGICLSLARIYEGRSAYDESRRAYIHAATLFSRAGSTGAARAIIAQLSQAAMETSSGQEGSLSRASALVVDATAHMQGLGQQRWEAEVWLWRAQSRLAAIAGDYADAQRKSSQAADRADSMPSVFDETTRLTLRRDLASTYVRLAEWAPAQAILTKILDRELSLNGPRHAETLRVKLLLAEVRAAQGDVAGALADLDQIGPAIDDVFGHEHRVTLTLLATRADVLSRLARYDEALAVQMALYRITAAHDGPNSWTALGTLLNSAQTQCRAGQTEAGSTTARDAYDDSRRAFGEKHVLTQAAAGIGAFCLILEERYAQASELLDRLDPKAVGEMLMDPQYPSEVALMRAAIAIATGRAEAAKITLQHVSAVFETPDADRYMQHWAKQLLVMANARSSADIK